MSKRTIGMSGFTLAEVLITLGIIGVVAAMTMPTLINSTNGAQYKTAYKKALSVMSQAVAMNIALNDYDLSDTIKGTNATKGKNGEGVDDEAYTIYSIFRNRLNVTRVNTGQDFSGDSRDANFYPVISRKDSKDIDDFAKLHDADSTNKLVEITAGNVKTDDSGTSPWGENSTFLFMNDGITLIFDNTQENCRQATARGGELTDNYCYAYIDVNGQKGPNRVVECDDGSGEPTGGDGTDDYACTVSNPTDIYPIAMYNQTIIPASAAARAVLFAK